MLFVRSTRTFMQSVTGLKRTVYEFFVSGPEVPWLHVHEWAWFSGLFGVGLAAASVNEFGLAACLFILSAYSIGIQLLRWSNEKTGKSFLIALRFCGLAFIVISLICAVAVLNVYRLGKPWSQLPQAYRSVVVLLRPPTLPGALLRPASPTFAAASALRSSPRSSMKARARLHEISPLTICTADAERPFRCKNDADLKRWILDESDKLLQKSDEARSEMRATRSRQDGDRETTNGLIRSQLFFFTEDVTTCCMRDIDGLRAEARVRLGPRGQDSEEARDWASLAVRSGLPPASRFDFGPLEVSKYAMELKAMGEKLSDTREQR